MDFGCYVHLPNVYSRGRRYVEPDLEKNTAHQEDRKAMVDLAEIEARMRRIEDVEAIKRLKYRYWRCLDRLDWEGVMDCFAEDGAVDYAGTIKIDGKRALAEQLPAILGEHLGVHQGHHPEIDFTSDTTARGTWGLFVYALHNERKRGLRIVGFYEDEYVREDGQWKIRKSVMKQTFQERWKTEDMPTRFTF